MFENSLDEIKMIEMDNQHPISCEQIVYGKGSTTIPLWKYTQASGSARAIPLGIA